MGNTVELPEVEDLLEKVLRHAFGKAGDPVHERVKLGFDIRSNFEVARACYEHGKSELDSHEIAALAYTIGCCHAAVPYGIDHRVAPALQSYLDNAIAMGHSRAAQVGRRR